MSGDKSNQNDNIFDSRSKRGSNNNWRHPRGSTADQQERAGSNYSANQNENYHFASYQPPAKDDEARAYAVNLQLKPVEIGIKARNGRWENEFRGIGAFNHYFGLCAPTRGLGYTLPDIWDGYFHITLAKFFSPLTHDQLETAFQQFNPPLEDLPFIPDIVFRSTSIITHTGAYRARRLQGIDFVVLPITVSDQIEAFYEKVLLLLKKIERQAQANDWNVTSPNNFHVTIRKYSNFQYNLDNIKIGEFPLEFRCSHLEIKQPREQATSRYKESNGNYIWWNGVTEVNGRCSGCGTRVMSEVWEGFCLACGKYESVIPIWSTTGTTTQD